MRARAGRWGIVVGLWVAAGCPTKENPYWRGDEAAGSGSATATSSGGSTSGTNSTSSQGTQGVTTDASVGSDTQTGGASESGGVEGFGYRRRIIVVPDPNEPVPFETSLPVLVDTAGLITDGKVQVDGVDFRVVRCSAGDCREQDRWVDPWRGMGWNTSESWVWFSMQADVPADAQDDETWLYYGHPNPVGDPLRDMEEVFVFGDDFNDGLGRWDVQNPGQISLGTEDNWLDEDFVRFETPNGFSAGLSRDIALPDIPLQFSVLVKRTIDLPGSMGLVRAFSTPFDGRAPAWNENAGRLHLEYDDESADFVFASVLTAPTPWDSMLTDFNWYFVEVFYDPVDNTVWGQFNGNYAAGPVPAYNVPSPILSIAIEPEGDDGGGGQYFVDRYVVRRHLEFPPTVSLGSEEPL